MATIFTRFTDEYGIVHPIAQAGMAFAGMTPDLAAAVTRAGGLGSVAIGLMPPPVMADLVTATRTAADGPIDVNFITIFTTDDHIETLCATGVEVASFHWGHPPRRWIDRLHEAGIKVWEQVGSVDDAKRAVDDGVDLVVAQGHEAGGHNYGTLPTFALVPVVVDAVAPALVLASGGIADGRGLAAALMLGADGAWVGTRLVATLESSAHPGYKERLVGAAGTDTVRTEIFGRHEPDFNPIRVLRNPVVAEWHHRLDEVPVDNSDEPLIGMFDLMGQQVEMRRFSFLVPMAGATTGDLDQMALLSGQGVGLVDGIEPAAEVVARMVDDAAAILGRHAARVTS